MLKVKGLKIEEGYFWDYWLTDEGIFKVKILSKKLFALVFISLLVVVVAVAIFWGGVGYLIVLFLGAYIAAAWIAGSKRKKIASLSLEELLKKGMVEEKIEWSDVTSIEYIKKKLIIKWDKGELKVGIRERDLEYVRKFLEPKVGDKFKIIRESKKQ